MLEFEILDIPNFGSIRYLSEKGKMWFVGIDVAKILRYYYPNYTLRKHVESQNKIIREVPALSPKVKSQWLIMINVEGIKSLLQYSKLVEKIEFQSQLYNAIQSLNFNSEV